MLGSAIILTLLVAFTPTLRDTPSLYAVSFLYVIGTALFPVWLFQGLEQLKVAAIALGVARILTVPALFFWELKLSGQLIHHILHVQLQPVLDDHAVSQTVEDHEG